MPPFGILIVSGSLGWLPSVRAQAARPAVSVGAPPPLSSSGTAPQQPSTAGDVSTVLTGQINDRQGNPIVGAQLRLTIFTEANEALWSVKTAANEAGVFAIPASSLPRKSLALSRYAARLSVQADGFRAEAVELITSRDESNVTSIPRTVSLQLASLSRISTVVLFVPVLVGGILALLHFVRFVNRQGYASFVLFYSVTVALLWTFVVIYLLYRYAQKGETFLPMLFIDFAVPIGVVIASYVGTVTYVAYSVYTRTPDFFTPNNEASRQKLLHVMGGRLLVAPYIPLIAYGILATNFPTLNTSPFAIFFGFPMWIKVVEELLNDVGKRFLSDEARRRLTERLADTTHTSGWSDGGISAGLRQLIGDRYEYRIAEHAFTLPVDRSRLCLRFSEDSTADERAKAAKRLDLTRTEQLSAPDQAYSLWKAPVDTEEEYRTLMGSAAATRVIIRPRGCAHSRRGQPWPHGRRAPNGGHRIDSAPLERGPVSTVPRCTHASGCGR